MAHITTALTLLSLCSIVFGQWAEYYITTQNGGIWGSWGPIEWCPHGSKAKGFAIKVESKQGNGDDTAANAIRLYCYDRNDNYKGSVQSTESGWGTWGNSVKCSNGHIQSYKAKVEENQGKGDDTALNNIIVQCSNGQQLEAHGGPWGSYGVWSKGCKFGVCGIKTRVGLIREMEMTPPLMTCRCIAVVNDDVPFQSVYLILLNSSHGPKHILSNSHSEMAAAVCTTDFLFAGGYLRLLHEATINQGQMFRLNRTNIFRLYDLVKLDLDPETARSRSISGLRKLLAVFHFMATGSFQAVTGDVIAMATLSHTKPKWRRVRANGDDTALNNIMVQCSNCQRMEVHGGPWGTYGAWSNTCWFGVCGIKTRVEPPQGNGDDTALNDLEMYCCSE
ncbi:uncharacterized protein LOC134934147 [Pseudophryne corroboree]|uniref:uncharacterized protein LOC134934147 n=1 Tax=Pseudophryne corroboree TaxID=495146 RepID=UPI0030815AAB